MSLQDKTAALIASLPEGEARTALKQAYYSALVDPRQEEVLRHLREFKENLRAAAGYARMLSNGTVRVQDLKDKLNALEWHAGALAETTAYWQRWAQDIIKNNPDLEAEAHLMAIGFEQILKKNFKKKIP